MNLTPLLILPVIGGYILSNAYIPSYYASARESNHRLYFRCVQYGLYLSIVSVAFHSVLYQIELYQEFVNAANAIFKTQSSASGRWSNGAIAVILVMSFLVPHLIHIVGFAIKTVDPLYREKKLREYHSKAIKNDELMKLLTYSVSKEMPIMFTLDTGKVYVGWPNSEPNPTLEIRFIRILPYLSGYRDKDTHKEEFTTDYAVIIEIAENPEDDALQHLNLQDFEILIPVGKITSAHLFDVDAYLEFKKQEPVFNHSPNNETNV